MNATLSNPYTVEYDLEEFGPGREPWLVMHEGEVYDCAFTEEQALAAARTYWHDDQAAELRDRISERLEELGLDTLRAMAALMAD